MLKQIILMILMGQTLWVQTMEKRIEPTSLVLERARTYFLVGLDDLAVIELNKVIKSNEQPYKDFANYLFMLHKVRISLNEQQSTNDTLELQHGAIELAFITHLRLAIKDKIHYIANLLLGDIYFRKFEKALPYDKETYYQEALNCYNRASVESCLGTLWVQVLRFLNELVDPAKQKNSARTLQYILFSEQEEAGKMVREEQRTGQKSMYAHRVLEWQIISKKMVLKILELLLNK